MTTGINLGLSALPHLIHSSRGAIVRPMFLGTILRQQQPCREDPVGTFQPGGSRTRVVLIRGSRARASALGRETTSLDDIAWFERILAETPAFEQLNRRGAFECPANRFAVFRLLFHGYGGVGIGPHITYDGAPDPDGCCGVEHDGGVMCGQRA